MREADFFQPKMDASAAHRDPGAAEPNIVDAQEETSGSDNDEGHDALKKEKLQNPETFQETVLGLDESHGNDPLRQFMTLQKRMQIVQEEGDKLMRRQSRYHHHEKSDELNTSIQAGSEQCKQYLLEVRDIAKKMIGNDESNDMDTASFLKKIGVANESTTMCRGLHITIIIIIDINIYDVRSCQTYHKPRSWGSWGLRLAFLHRGF